MLSLGLLQRTRTFGLSQRKADSTKAKRGSNCWYAHVPMQRETVQSRAAFISQACYAVDQRSVCVYLQEHESIDLLRVAVCAKGEAATTLLSQENPKR